MEYRDLYDKNRNLTGKTIAKDARRILYINCSMFYGK